MVFMAISKVYGEIGKFTTTYYAQFIPQMVKDKKSHTCDSFEVMFLECKFELFSLLSLVGVTKWYSWDFPT
jgi:hypothetical protein